MGQLTKSAWIGLIALVALTIGTPYRPAVAQAKDPCFDYADPVRVKLGETEFHIPARYAPSLYDTTGKSLRRTCLCRSKTSGTPEHSYCQTTDDPPFQIAHFFIDFRISAPITGVHDPVSKFDMRVDPAYAPPSEMHCKAKRDIEAKTDKWLPYASAEGFFEAQRVTSSDKAHGAIYYYSETHRLFGLPLLIECGRREFTKPDHSLPPIDGYAQSSSIGRPCRFSSPLGDTHRLYVRFYDKQLPPSQWGAASREIERFVRTIMVPPADNVRFSSCQQPPSKGE